MASYISKIKVPGVTEAYLIKDNEGRLMIAEAYSSSESYSTGDYYVEDGTLRVVTGGTGIETTVGAELQSIKQSIAGAMHYIGVTKTELTDGSTITTLVPQSEGSLTKTSGFVAGDVVLAPAPEGSKEKYYEYVYNGTVWSEFGSTMAIGSMAYANTATGSTTITYNKSNYTGGTITVKEYSERESNYIKPSSVVGSVEVSTTTSASSVSKSVSKLVTTSVGVVGDTGAAVTNITTTQKGLATTNIQGVSGTGSAVTNITTTQKGLATTQIYGVESEGVSVSKVSGGSKTINVGATQTTSVVSGLGSTAAAAGSNPFVNATVDADECLSWIEKPLTNKEIREASKQDITVQNLTVEQVTGIAKVASNSVTVATGELTEGGSGIITDVTGTTDSFAKQGDIITVATGGLVEKDDEGSSVMVVVDVTGTTDSFAKKADNDVVVATGRLSENGGGDDVNGSINISVVEGLVTGLSVANEEVLIQGNSGDEDSIKVLSGITSTDATKDITLAKGEDITDIVNVTIQVKPDARPTT